MRRSLVLSALLAALVWAPVRSGADSRFTLPRISVVETSPRSSEAIIRDEASDGRERLEVGERYRGAYRLVAVESERIVLRQEGPDTIYYVLPLRSDADRQRARRAEEDSPALAPIDPYGEESIENAVAPERSRASRPPAPPREDAEGTTRGDSRRADARTERDDRARHEEARAPKARHEETRKAHPEEAIEDRKLSRQALDEAIARRNELEDKVTIRAEPEGIAVASLDPDTFVYEIGLREGDIIRRVAGRKLDSIEAAAALYAHLARADSFRVEILREGRKRLLRYRLVP